MQQINGFAQVLFALTVSERNNIQLKVYQITAKNNEKYKNFEHLKAQKHQKKVFFERFSLKNRYFSSFFSQINNVITPFLILLRAFLGLKVYQMYQGVSLVSW